MNSQVILLLDFNDFNFLTPTGKKIVLCIISDNSHSEDFICHLIIQWEGY